jgi:hypothetical protein
VGLNSLFGIIPYVIEKTGLSYRQIMWELSWTNIEMMLIDMPKTVKKSAIIRKSSGRDALARHRQKYNG